MTRTYCQLSIAMQSISSEVELPTTNFDLAPSFSVHRYAQSDRWMKIFGKGEGDICIVILNLYLSNKPVHRANGSTLDIDLEVQLTVQSWQDAEVAGANRHIQSSFAVVWTRDL